MTINDKKIKNFQDKSVRNEINTVDTLPHESENGEWTKEMIIEEAKKYISGEKKFSNFKDLSQMSFETVSGRNIVEFEDDGKNDYDGNRNEENNNNNGLYMEKVVTKMNGTIYLYIPKDSKDHPPDLNKIAQNLNARSMDGGGYEGGSNCEWGSWSSDSEGRCIKIKDQVMS